MGTTERPPDIRRIVLAQGTAGGHPEALTLAVRLARRLRIELHNLLVEDQDLQRAAQWAQAMEILPGGASQPLRGADISRHGRAQASTLREQLSGQADLSWSITQITGTMSTAAGEFRQAGDLLMISPRADSSTRRDRAHGAPLLIDAQICQCRSFHLLADEMGQAGGRTGSPSYRLETLTSSDPGNIIKALQQHQPGWLLGSASTDLLQASTLQGLLKALRCPLILLPLDDEDGRESR